MGITMAKSIYSWLRWSGEHWKKKKLAVYNHMTMPLKPDFCFYSSFPTSSTKTEVSCWRPLQHTETVPPLAPSLTNWFLCLSNHELGVQQLPCLLCTFCTITEHSLLCYPLNIIIIILLLFQKMGVRRRNKQPTMDVCDRMILLSTGLGHSMTFFKTLNRLKKLTEVMKNGWTTSRDLNCSKNS